MDYFSVDIESSGPIPGTFSLLSIGVTHVRRYKGRYRMFADLYLELAPEFEGVHPPAMAVHGLDLDELSTSGVPSHDAMEQFVAWVREQQKDRRERPVFVAHNAPFDWMFISYYLHHFALENPFGHSAIDTKALAMGAFGIPWNQTSLKSVASMLEDVPKRDERTLHHAGADARYQAEVFAALMNRSRA